MKILFFALFLYVGFFGFMIGSIMAERRAYKTLKRLLDNYELSLKKLREDIDYLKIKSIKMEEQDDADWWKYE